MNPLNDLTSIFNILVMPEEVAVKNNSPFQGFLNGLIYKDYHELLRNFILFPHNIMEIFMTQSEIIQSRNESSFPTTFLLSPSAILKYPYLFNAPFTIITYLDKDEDFVFSILKEFQFKPITVSLNKNADLNLRTKNNFSPIDSLIYGRIKELSKTPSFKEPLSDLLSKKKVREINFTADISIKAHGVTFPNIATLNSLGIRFPTETTIEFSKDADNYVEAIIESAKYLVKFKSNLKNICKSNLVLFCPSCFSYLYDFNSHFWNQILRNLDNRSYKEFIKKGLIKNPNYSGIEIEIEEPFNPYEIPTVKEILMIRQKELALTTISATMLAISNNAPAIRLPNAVNFQNNKLKDIELYSQRSDQRGEKLLKRSFIKLVNDLKTSIGQSLQNYIYKESQLITILSDAPIEWITLKNIPLMFSHEVSRIPTTPGNMLLQLSSFSLIVELQPSDLKSILVIRSFNDDDPIKYLLEQAVKQYSQIDNVSDIKFVDVKTSEELISNLNNYEGDIIIFDCHGNHGGNESHGWLQIGEEQIDTWNLSEKARVPPIVILSVCLTSAASGSHASIANGFISSGALSVLSTFLPIDPIKGAIFIGRLVYRLSGFINALAKLNYDVLTWRTFISGLFKMSYTTDILRAFKDDFNFISSEDYMDIHNNVNMKININDEFWFDYLIERVSTIANKTPQELYSLISKELPFVETMYYLQIGRPENIIIKTK